RDEELELALKCVRGGAWVAILGLRMSGKTSLAKVIASELKKESFESLYVNLIGVGGLRACAERILSSLPRPFVEHLESLKIFLEFFNVKVGGEVKLSHTISSARILERVFLELSRKKKLIVVLDEVQEINGGIKQFLALLYRLRTTAKNLTFVFTGSAIGLMKTLLYPAPTNPLYGRSPIKIELKAWEEETALEYLKQGLNECGVGYLTRELREVVFNLGTLPGWLSFYGLRRCVGLSHERSLREAEEEAIKIAENEIRNVLRNRGDWAKKALKMLAYGARWGEMLKETSVSAKTLSDLLQTTKSLYLVVEENDVYKINDPVYRKAVLRIT
ncbi:MAG: AAA family ATPase, partial [Thermoprotei archaeon]